MFSNYCLLLFATISGFSPGASTIIRTSLSTQLDRHEGLSNKYVLHVLHTSALIVWKSGSRSENIQTKVLFIQIQIESLIHPVSVWYDVNRVLNSELPSLSPRSLIRVGIQFSTCNYFNVGLMDIIGLSLHVKTFVIYFAKNKQYWLIEYHRKFPTNFKQVMSIHEEALTRVINQNVNPPPTCVTCKIT